MVENKIELFNKFLRKEDDVYIYDIIEGYKEFANTTQILYADLLNAFKNWLLNNNLDLNIDNVEEIIDKYMTYLKSRKRQHSYIVSNRRLLEKVFKIPKKKIRKHRDDTCINKKEPETMTEDEVKKLIEYCSEKINDDILYSCVLIQAFTGIRFDELFHLQIKDLYDLLKESELKIICSKSYSTRTIILPDMAKEIFKKIVSKLVLKNKLDYFLSRPKPVPQNYKRTLYTRYNNLLKQISCTIFDINKRPITTHSMRRAYAVTVYKSCRDPNIARLLMGHQNMTTTMKYLKVDNKELKDKARVVEF